MTTRFCTSCQCDREIEGGIVKQTRSSPRWLCRACVEKKSYSLYQSHANKTQRMLDDIRRQSWQR